MAFLHLFSKIFTFEIEPFTSFSQTLHATPNLVDVYLFQTMHSVIVAEITVKYHNEKLLFLAQFSTKLNEIMENT